MISGAISVDICAEIKKCPFSGVTTEELGGRVTESQACGVAHTCSYLYRDCIVENVCSSGLG